MQSIRNGIWDQVDGDVNWDSVSYGDTRKWLRKIYNTNSEIRNNIVMFIIMYTCFLFILLLFLIALYFSLCLLVIIENPLIQRKELEREEKFSPATPR